MIKIFISIAVFMNGFALIKAQSVIDYKPKLLLRELTSAKGQSQFLLSEIVLQDVVASQVYKGKFFRFEEQATACKYVYIGRVNSCRSGGCSVKPENSVDQTSEYFDYFILFDANCAVQQVKVYNYQATHGQEITATGWLKQFIGYNGEKELNTGKNIDAISGATISVEGIIYDIQDKTRLLKQILKSE